ncbi:hypothetical protein [Bacillus atrophaeus]
MKLFSFGFYTTKNGVLVNSNAAWMIGDNDFSFSNVVDIKYKNHLKQKPKICTKADFSTPIQGD